jgi:squalene-hopene/tetraprenyl-beta-curcumene cyclase
MVLTALLCTAQAGAPALSQAPADPNEPRADKLSLRRSADYLDKVALAWTEDYRCGACHTNYPYLMARPALKVPVTPALAEVRKFFEGRAANWETAKPRSDTEVVATAVSLAFHDAAATGKLQPLTRQALDRMWTLQREDGAWSWLKCNWPPQQHDDYYGAVWAAVGVGVAPDGYAQTPAAREGLGRLRGYLQKTPAPDAHHQAMLLWASQRVAGLMTGEQQRAAIGRLLSLQRPDGGWSLPSLGNYKRRDKKGANDATVSDGYGTGFVVYILRRAGVPATHEQIQKGVGWLRQNQRVSGRWFTRSLSTDDDHFIANAGTAFAVLALTACDVRSD